MIFDTHMHTELSFDSSEQITKILEEAAVKNLGVITTEHKDLNYLEVGGFPIDFDVDEYFRLYEKYRSDTYLMGIELGLDRRYTDKIREIQEKYDFDIVIGSLHTMDGINLSSRKYFKSQNEKDFYRTYLRYAEEMVRDSSFIDALAHFDYPTRYSGFSELRYEAYEKELSALFKTMVREDVTLEINLKRPLIGEVYHSFRSIYKGYYENGGRYVTLASDAHVAEDIGRNFDEAIKLADDIGLEICYYKNRKRVLCDR
ncbi:PHP domain-containing protein [Proteiniclasticum sp. C24MP]|uniref:PHP domain-containing protein n=1 Tax=Proteiniclasticum sp. C24MP TaxID=3374101 RepID=UPI003754A52F